MAEAVNSATVSEAIVTWTGWGRSMSPDEDEALVVRRFGATLAGELLPLVRQLVNEFYSSDAQHVPRDLSKMGEIAEGQFRQKHPELSEEAVRALGWCYTFDNR
jgi:hypothetical protein